MAVETLASLEELEVRLEFELDDDRMKNLAQAALEDATTLVREYGVKSWTVETAPPIAVMLVLKAAARFVNNPMSLEVARGADETNQWGSGAASGVHLEPAEIELLRQNKKVDRGLQSVPTFAWSSRPAPRNPYPAHHLPALGYGNGEAKMWPDYFPGDEYLPVYPSDWRARR